MTLALTVSVGVKWVGVEWVEWVAVTGRFTDNILWSPDTGPRAALLAVRLLPWVPLAVDLSTQRR